MRYILVFILFVFLFPKNGNSQESSLPAIDIHPNFGTGMVFNSKDFYVGFQAGIRDLGFNWGSTVVFNFRPYYKRVWTAPENDTIYQYDEKRMLLALETVKEFFLITLPSNEMQIGPFLLARGGINFGSYLGTSKSPQSGLVIVPGAGLAMYLKEGLLIRGGLMLFEDYLESVPNQKAFININFTIK